MSSALRARANVFTVGLPVLCQETPEATDASSRSWLQVLGQYREPNHLRSTMELCITLVAFAGLWLAAWWALSISFWLALAISVPAAVFLVRLFLIQHDSGHGAFFRRRVLNDWVGRMLGVLTLTPYEVWRHSHAIHHATTGNLDKRGVGDIDTLTVREYQKLSRLRRLAYRLYRHPLIMFGIGPVYHFLIRNRVPLLLRRADWRTWSSAMGTNIMIGLLAAVLIYSLGAVPFLLVQLPILLLASSIGVWLFYVQHQFEDTYWAEEQAWDMPDAALHGSTHYDLPGVLVWLTASIGVHHVHHLNSRIPFYRLREVLRDYPELASVRRLTLMQSFACARLRLWDEGHRQLVPFPKS